jgi:signal transduction histidine kinase
MGGTLAEVVPQLLSRIVESVGARVGLVSLFRGDHDDLELISPLLVSGRTVRAEGYRLSLTDAGVVQRVFTTGRPLLSNDPVSGAGGDPLLGELDTSRLAAVAMSVNSRPVGVLVVADKSAIDFNDEDIARLQSLAGPAGLVMNQMDRFGAAQEMGQKMAELAQLKSDFVSVVSHELRSPLTTIIGSLRTVLRPGIEIGAQTANELTSTAARQADRLRELIEDLLVASRRDSNALPVRPEPTSVSELIDDLLIDLPAAVERVAVHVDSDVPEVNVDPAHLGRILRNLVGNALKYASGSPIEITVSVAAEQVWLAIVAMAKGSQTSCTTTFFRDSHRPSIMRHGPKGVPGSAFRLCAA